MSALGSPQRQPRGVLAVPGVADPEFPGGPRDRLDRVPVDQVGRAGDPPASREGDVRHVLVGFHPVDGAERVTQPAVERPEVGALNSQVYYRSRAAGRPLEVIESGDAEVEPVGFHPVNGAAVRPEDGPEPLAEAGQGVGVVVEAGVEPFCEQRVPVPNAVEAGQLGVEFAGDAADCSGDRYVQAEHGRMWVGSDKSASARRCLYPLAQCRCMYDLTPTRRRVVAATAGTLAGVTAGCSGDRDGGSGSGTADTADTDAPTDAPEPTDTDAPEPTDTDGQDLDLREANVVGVTVESDGDTYDFDVTLHHDDGGEDGYANWWQVERLNGEQLGRRELRHAHSQQPFTRSTTVEIHDDVACVVVRGHDETHGYGGRAAAVDLASGTSRGIDQGPERRPIDPEECPTR